MPAIQSRRTALIPPTARPSARRPAIVALDDHRALDADLAGAKAANLARAATRRAPVAAWLRDHDRCHPRRCGRPGRRRGGAAGMGCAVRGRQRRPRRALLVDGRGLGTTSMAGQFTSVLDVRGWTAFLEAVSTVLRSAQRPKDEVTDARPMAVLVQPQLDPVCGGVLFGLDPVTGDGGHLVVEAVPGTPDVLVSGVASAVHCVLDPRGRLVGAVDPRAARAPRAFAPTAARPLARRPVSVFDGPQDVEWAFDQGDRLWLLQSRRSTRPARTPSAAARCSGPGPVAETFPEPLRRLEAKLWVEPLRDRHDRRAAGHGRGWAASHRAARRWSRRWGAGRRRSGAVRHRAAPRTGPSCPQPTARGAPPRRGLAGRPTARRSARVGR